MRVPQRVKGFWILGREVSQATLPSSCIAAGWKSLVYAERNMELVTEHRQIAETEKVMVYLSRKPGLSNGSIQWKFDFTKAGKKS